jgi:hypothetical protein
MLMRMGTAPGLMRFPHYWQAYSTDYRFARGAASWLRPPQHGRTP